MRPESELGRMVAPQPDHAQQPTFQWKGEAGAAWRRAVFGFAVVFFAWAVILENAQDPARRNDFNLYWAGADRVMQGASPYGVDFSKEEGYAGLDWSEPYGLSSTSNPPLLVLLLVPLAWGTPEVAWWLWTLGGHGALALALAWLAPVRRSRDWLVVLGVGGLSFPILDGIRHGQVSALLAAWMVGAAWAMGRGRCGQFAAGGLAGLAAAAKFYLLPLGFFFLSARSREGVVGFASGLVGGLALPALVFGPSIYAEWMRHGMEVIRVGEMAYTNNLSLQGLVLKLASAGGVDFARLEWLRWASLALGAVVCGWVGQGGGRVRAVLLAVAWCSLLSPVCWPHYGVHQLPLVLGLVGWGQGRWALLYWAVAFSLAAYALLPVAGSAWFFGLQTVVQLAVLVVLSGPWAERQMGLPPTACPGNNEQ